MVPPLLVGGRPVRAGGWVGLVAIAMKLAGRLMLALSMSYFTMLYAVPRLLIDGAGWTTVEVGFGELVVLASGAAAWGLVAARSARRSTVLRAVVLGLGALAQVFVATSPWAGLLLVASGLGLLAAGFQAGAVLR